MTQDSRRLLCWGCKSELLWEFCNSSAPLTKRTSKGRVQAWTSCVSKLLNSFESISKPKKARGKGTVHDPRETFGEEVFLASFLLVHLQFFPLCMMYMESRNCFSLGFFFVLFYPKPSVLATLWNPVDMEKVYICKNKLSQNRSC